MVLINRIKERVFMRLLQMAIRLELQRCEKLITDDRFDRELSGRIDCLQALRKG